jgi:acyl dehydratase
MVDEDVFQLYNQVTYIKRNSMESPARLELPEALSPEHMQALIGVLEGWSDWTCIDQARIDQFAAATGDDAFIHVDPVRAGKTRFSGTIAHGLLILSLLPRWLRTTMPPLRNTRMGINYGFERTRFMTPVPAGGRVRGHFRLAAMRERQGLHVMTYEVTVQLEGEAKPALTATWLLGRWLDKAPPAAR